MRILGFTDYEIRDFASDGQPVKSPVRLEYYPAVVPGAEGWDIGADPTIGPIVRELQFSDHPSSQLLTIRIGTRQQSDVVALFPVYEDRDRSELQNIQNQGFSGLFVIGYNPRVLIGGSVEEFEDRVAVEILAGNKIESTSTTDYLYQSANFEYREGCSRD